MARKGSPRLYDVNAFAYPIRRFWGSLCKVSKFWVIFFLGGLVLLLLTYRPIMQSSVSPKTFVIFTVGIFLSIAIYVYLTEKVNGIVRKIKNTIDERQARRIEITDGSLPETEEAVFKNITPERTDDIGSIIIPQNSEYDELLPKAVEAIFQLKYFSLSEMKRLVPMDYSQAARIADQMEKLGFLSEYDGAKPRMVIVTHAQAKKVLQKIASKETIPNGDWEQIIKEEQEWLRKQRGLSPVESELVKIDFMEGHKFEYWCAELLKTDGFYNVNVTPASNDMGVDILAEKDAIKYAIQCKCYSSNLGNTPVQEVNAGKSFYNCHVGVVMTNRHFTQGAKNLANATGTLLWDRDHIKKLLEKENDVLA